MKLEDLHKVTVCGDGFSGVFWMECTCGWKGPKRPNGVEDHVLEIDKLVHWVGQIQEEDPRNWTAPREAFNS